MRVELDAGGTQWLYMYARKNYWKVRHIYDDVADLIQDGHMCWGIVVQKYTAVGDLTKDGRLMSLFKMTFSNHIIWTASRDKDKQYNYLKQSLDELVDRSDKPHFLDTLYERSGQSGDMYTDPLVGRAIVEASEPIRSVLKFLVSEAGICIMQRPFRRRLDGSRETVNSRISRNIGFGSDLDLLSMTKAYLLEVAQ